MPREMHTPLPELDKDETMFGFETFRVSRPSANDLFEKIASIGSENGGVIPNPANERQYDANNVAKQVKEIIREGKDVNYATRAHGIREDVTAILEYQDALRDAYDNGEDMFAGCDIDEILNAAYIYAKPFVSSSGKEYDYDDIYERVHGMTELADALADSGQKLDFRTSPIRNQLPRDGGLRHAVCDALNRRISSDEN